MKGEVRGMNYEAELYRQIKGVNTLKKYQLFLGLKICTFQLSG